MFRYHVHEWKTYVVSLNCKHFRMSFVVSNSKMCVCVRVCVFVCSLKAELDCILFSIAFIEFNWFYAKIGRFFPSISIYFSFKLSKHVRTLSSNLKWMSFRSDFLRRWTFANRISSFRINSKFLIYTFDKLPAKRESFFSAKIPKRVRWVDIYGYNWFVE